MGMFTPEDDVVEIDRPAYEALKTALRIAGEELAAASAAVSALRWERLMQYGMLLEVAEKCSGPVREVARDEIRRRDAERKAGT